MWRVSQVHIYILYIPLILVCSLFDSLKAKNVKELLISADMVMVYTYDDDYFADKLWLLKNILFVYGLMRNCSLAAPRVYSFSKDSVIFLEDVIKTAS